MGDLGPGDFVECVNASGRFASDPPSGLLLGALYTVEAVYINDEGRGLTLVGLRASSPFVGYAIDRFRPIYRPKASVIESMLAPAPEMEPA